MPAEPDFSQFTTEQLLSTCPLPLVTITEAYAVLAAVAKGGVVDREQAEKTATALLAVIMSFHAAAETG